MNFSKLVPAFAICLLIAQLPCRAASVPINFKVSTLIDSSHEGPDRTRTFFVMDGKRIAFKAPPKVELTDTNDSITCFLQKRGVDGQFSVANSPEGVVPDFVPEIQRFTDAAEKMIPAGAEKIEYKGSDFTSYAVNDRKCVALEYTYQLFGRTIHRQIAYINVDAQHQVCLDVLAKEEDWKDASGLARRFMNSWYAADEVRGPFTGEEKLQ